MKSLPLPFALPARHAATVLFAALALGGCAVGPSYETPSSAIAPAFKEAPPGWLAAAPADALDRGPWWTLFGDPGLDALASQVTVSNQNVAAATAAYAQARALVAAQRSTLWPVLTADGGVSRSGGDATTQRGSRYQATLGASWEADVWGRLSSAVTAAGASAEASAADLASATLSAQAEVANNYFSLREADLEAELLRRSIEAYRRSLQITQNRYAAGLGLKTDVLQAQTQLASAESDLTGLERQRAQLEHAIAVLVGQSPSAFAVAPAPWNAEALPGVPLGLPSTLLQRRPDIAAAQRRVAAANAQLGVAQAAFFPSFSLTGQYGFAARNLSDLFSPSAAAWSLGTSLAQTLFDAGGRRAQVEQARASWEQSVAQYRQTVLTAFQGVEDQLASARVLERQLAFSRQASEAADQTEVQVENRYRAGQVSYTEVVTAQISALNARRSVAQLVLQRQTAAVGLIQALGGGWKAAALQDAEVR